MGKNKVSDSKSAKEEAAKNGVRGGRCSCIKNYGKPLNPVTTKRKTTDILCCGIFIAFWGGMFAIMTIGFIFGSPMTLIYARDYAGRTCGLGDLSGRNKVYYPRLNEDILEAAPELYSSASSGSVPSYSDIKLFGLCVGSCPSQGDIVCTYGANNSELNDPSVPDYSVGIGGSNYDLGCSNNYEDCNNNRGGADLALPEASRLIKCQTDLVYRLTNDDLCSSCWIVPLPTTEILFRCIFQYENEQVTWCERCTQPSSVCTPESLLCQQNPSDPMCVPTETEPYVDPYTSGCVAKKVTSTLNETKLATENPVIEYMTSFITTIGRWFTDIINSVHVVVLVGGVGAIFIGFWWIFTLKYFAAVIVWGTIFSILGAFLAFTLLCYNQAGLLGEAYSSAVETATSSSNNVTTTSEVGTPSALEGTSTGNPTYWKYGAYVMTAVDVVFLITIVATARTIRLACQIIKEASKAIQKMPYMVFFPFHTVALSLALYTYWFVVAAYVYSSGDITTGELQGGASDSITSLGSGSPLDALYCINQTEIDGSTQIDGSPMVNCSVPTVALGDPDASLARYMMLYHLFGGLWMNQFIQGIGMMVVAGAVSHWYWTLPNERGRKNMKYPADKKWCCVRGGPFRKAKGPFKRCCPDPVSWSMWRTYRYHLGTVAFGSFIIAVVQFLRIVLAYIDQRTKKLQKKSKLVRFLMKFVQVLMWIFEKTMKYVSRSAYIMCAMTGDSFCTSTKNAVLLFIEFLKELSVTKVIATIMIILGKVLVVAISATLGFLWLKFDPDFQRNGARELSSTHLPTLIIVTLSFAVAEGFMHVYGLSIDTILLCYCQDVKINSGTYSMPYRMSRQLQRITGHRNEKGAGIAEDEVEEDAGSGVAKKESKAAKRAAKAEVMKSKSQTIDLGIV